ncbi:hypothetical protein L2E82_28382 [Cichorium intybus]|uniref:Uncharacterized protein n=1 Tax=Cichorium intybus TaxID=13427 RepID=A0ACB9CVG9_CICIN|nr:hypothetical protein L2E82_28382 [Cichorium intybus]
MDIYMMTTYSVSRDFECFSILDAYDADINAENAIEDQGAEVNGENAENAEVNAEVIYDAENAEVNGAKVNGEDEDKDEDEDEDEDEDDDFNIDDANLVRSSLHLHPVTRAQIFLQNLRNFLSPSTGFCFPMAEGPASPGGGSHESGELSPRSLNVREQDRFLPIANISRIMKKALPANAKMAKDAKESVQEAVSEFISFITSEASDKCQKEKRKTINGDDLLWAMATLEFEDYIDPLKLYLSRYRVGISSFCVPLFWGFDLRVKLITDEFMFLFLYALERIAISDDGVVNKFHFLKGDTKGSAKGQRDGVQPDHNDQLAHQDSYLEGLDYGNSQAQHLMLPIQGGD